MTRAQGNMDFRILCKALNEIAQERLTDQVLFHVMGEPLLYPELERAVKYAKEKGLKVFLTTNGSSMTEGLLDNLLVLNIDHILFSVQTPDIRSFELRQANIGFMEYKKKITALIGKILDSGTNTKTTLSFLTTPFKKILLPSRKFTIIDTKVELIEGFNSWIQGILGAMRNKDVAQRIISGSAKLVERVSRFNLLGWNKLQITKNFIFETRVLGDWVHPGLLAKRIKKATFGSCEGLVKHFGILWNGDMVFCCVDFDGNTTFANLSSSTIKDAFLKEDVRSAIEDLKKFRISHPYCQRCLGDVSLSASLARQIGSIFYFLWLRKRWAAKRDREEAVLYG